MRALALERARAHLAERGLDAWLVHDFGGTNPVLAELLGDLPHATRRVFLLVPAAGPVRLLVHAIEAPHFHGLAGEVETYRDRRSLVEALGRLLGGCRTAAMEYSPMGQLPTMSWVDGGTLELVRSLGVEVTSSADLFQAAVTTWSAEAQASHRTACAHVAEVKDRAFGFISDKLATGEPCTEYAVQQMMVDEFARRGLETDHPPIVGVNAHSGDPHHGPAATGSAEIHAGDWVLIDLWARLPGRANVYSDITWVAQAGGPVPPERGKVFDIVRGARDLVVDELRRRWDRGEPVQGWELDRAARDHIELAGYAGFFPHRTGHSLGPGPAVHGLGVNLDDVETHDTRQVQAGCGFTVEPGIYLPEFGVRLEIDVYVDPETGPEVTTPMQDEIVILA